MSYESRVEDGIIIFTFNKPKVNSITTETLKGLDEAVDRLNSDEDLKGMVLTGAGKVFSGGFDLVTFTTFPDADSILKWFEFEEEVLLKLFTCKKPVVSAINGGATAAGMILAMATDYRIAIDHPKVKIGMTEIKIGLSLTPAEAEIMRFGLGTDKNFRDIIMKGELVSTAFCVERGIFDELAPAEELVPKAKAKVSALYDTPGHPFEMLKFSQKLHAANWIREGLQTYDWNMLVKTFTDPNVINTLKMVLASIS